MPRLLALVIAMSMVTPAGSAWAATYYVDFFSGSDANTGTLKYAPWQHAPGMNGCAANCSATMPAAGDRIIFKGGVTWDYTIWPWTLPSSGTASSTAVGCDGGVAGAGCIYYGVDSNWFAGSAWTRPVFSGGGWTTPNTACNYDQGMPGHNLINASGQKYWIIDNFEFTGMCSASGTDGGNFGQGSYILMTNASGTDYFDIENSYFHGWMFPSTFVPSRTSNPSPGDYTKSIIGASAGAANDEKHGEVHDNVFDGSDATNALLSGYATGEGMYGGPGTVFRNVFKDVPESLDPADLITLHDNLFLNGNAVSLSSGSNGAGVHEHLFNSTYDECNATVYNNVAITVAAGEGYNPNVGSGCTEFIFNNIATDVTMAINGAAVNTFLLSATDTSGIRYVFNNTCEGGPDAAPGPQQGCYRELSPGGALNLYNNHTITSASSIVGVDAGTLSQVTNITQTQSASNSQGYSFSQTFQFSPTAAVDATVAAGTNETAVCNLIPDASAKAACMQDTTYAVAYDAENHKVIPGPARTPNPRSTSGAWDAGAYSFSPASSVLPPAAVNGNITTAENTAANGTLSATGTGPLSFAIASQPVHGMLKLTNAASGAFTYIPDADFSGSDAFTFTASNSGGPSNPATENITVTAASPPPSGGGGGALNLLPLFLFGLILWSKRLHTSGGPACLPRLRIK